MSYPFSPGAPAFLVLPTTIFQLEGSVRTATMLAMLDTGSDGTLVPRRLLTTINADQLHSTRIHSHWGDTRTAIMFIVDIEIAGMRMPAVEVVADEHGSDVLLGRNVLNRLILLLDGPRQATDVLTRRPLRL
jgi:predicted aspartyl protease